MVLKRKKFYNWNWKTGISQSILMSFLRCRMESKLSVVEGYKSRKVKPATLWGTIFHKLVSMIEDEEFHSVTEMSLDYRLGQIELEMRKKSNIFSQEEEMADIINEVSTVALAYCKRYEKPKKKKVIGKELSYKVSYKVEGIPDVHLVAQFDELYTVLDNSAWILETKTKARFNEDALEESLGLNFQCMYYLTMIDRLIKMKQVPATKIGGLCYNIVRRPGIHRRTKKSPENETQYSKRLLEDIKKRPDFYFIRLTLPITLKELREWQKKTLNPLLRDFYNWTQNLEEKTYANPQQCYNVNGMCDFFAFCHRNETSSYAKKESTFEYHEK